MRSCFTDRDTGYLINHIGICMGYMILDSDRLTCYRIYVYVINMSYVVSIRLFR